MRRQRSRLVRNVGLAAAVTLAVAACGSSGATGEQGAGDEGTQTEFTIELSEFVFSPDSITLPAGETLTLTLKNSGSIEHEFMLGRSALEDGGYMEDLLAQLEPEVVSGHGYKLMGIGDHDEGATDNHDEGATDNHDEGATDNHDEGAADNHGSMLLLEAGGEVTLTLTIPADATGTWEMGCFLPGHDDAGMKGTVTISG